MAGVPVSRVKEAPEAMRISALDRTPPMGYRKPPPLETACPPDSMVSALPPFAPTIRPPLWMGKAVSAGE